MERVLRMGAACIAHLSRWVPAFSTWLDACFPLPEGNIQLCYVIEACADDDGRFSADPHWGEWAVP